MVVIGDDDADGGILFEHGSRFRLSLKR